MAQTGYTPISIYYSATGGNTPTAGNLVAGELAINTADGKLFYKDSAGVVQTIASKDSNAGTFTNINLAGYLKFTNTTTAPSGASIFAPAGTTIAFSPNGAEAMRINSSNNVGIGITAPTSRLHVSSSAGNIINFTDGTTTGSLYAGIAQLGLFDSADTNGYVIVPASNYLYLATAGAERMRITSAGYVGIGINNPSYPLHVYGGGQLASFQNNTGNAYIGITDNNGVGNATFGSISGGNAYVYSGGYSSFYTGGGNENMRINANGNIALASATKTATGVGITFPATQSASSDANCLDDYEEGTFTPVLLPQTGTLTAYASNGYYVKVGRTVTITLNVTIATTGTASGTAQINGLPFQSISPSGFGGGQRAGTAIFREDGATGYFYGGYVFGGSTSMALTTLTYGAIVWTNGYSYVTSFVYETAA